MRNEAKVHPVLVSCKLVSGTNIRIYNMDDDMHGKQGIYKGTFKHTDGVMKALILIKEHKREYNFYTLPDTIRILD